ncbi:Alpha/Beta hydrolase protein [Camillea tinctor]|nr:Alpha/Beta hydrolase protein [Camillea tinctor]
MSPPLRYLSTAAAALLLLLHSPAAAQIPGAAVQCNTFNASHGPYTPASAAARIAQADVAALTSDATGPMDDAVLTAVNFERSNWAGTSARLDPFYADLGSNKNWTDLGPGQVVKVEQATDTSMYTLAHPLAMSRLVFTTRTFNGSVVPASAYVLWPFAPKKFSAGCADAANAENATGADVPVIAWGHGTSGWSGECGPSHIRNLWYQFMIFEAAVQGYAVVAPDYAGLGLDHDGNGNFIPHEYLASRAGGYDLLFAQKAALKAWPDVLSESYVVMGHSQGGGAAWGAAMILSGNDTEATALRKGYLGTIAGSPWTSFGTALGLQRSAASLSSLIARIATGARSVIPSFALSDWLTPLGVRAVELMQDLQGCSSVAAVLFAGAGQLVRADWRNATAHAQAFEHLTTVVGKDVAGPLLVLHGTGDAVVNATGVRAAVENTCALNPHAQVELLEMQGVGHTAVMFAGQTIWLDWVAERFRGVEARRGCDPKPRTLVKPLWDVGRYQKDRNWYIEYNQYGYSVA